MANIIGSSVTSFKEVAATGEMKFVDSFILPSELASQPSNPELSDKKQDMPRPHMVLPYKRGVIVPDMRSDLVFYLSVDTRTGKLAEIERIKMRPGDGPRHAEKHQSGTLYVIHKFSASITVLKEGMCGSTGLGVCTRIRILDEPVESGFAAAIRISEDQRFLYASVRLDGREIVDGKRQLTTTFGKIAAFELDSNGMIIRKVGEWSSEGIRPRDFFLVDRVKVGRKCRNFVAIVNRYSDHLVLVRRNKKTGALVGGIAFEERVDTPTSVLPL